jgi:chemotaxis signal transduction protein
LASSTPTPPTSAIPDDASGEGARDRVLLVAVAGVSYAFPVAQVTEVVRHAVLTPVPRAPALTRGLVNVRGLVVTVLDLAQLLARDPVVSVARVVDAPARADVALGDERVPPRDAEGELRRAGLGESIVLLMHRGRAVGVTVDAVHGVVPLEAEAPSGDAPVQHGAWVRATGRAALGLDADRLLAPVMLMAEEGR